MKVLPLVVGLFLTVTLAGCSDAAKQKKQLADVDPVSYQASNPALKNCRFEQPVVSYALNSTIQPNAVICDEGYVQSTQIVSQVPLPAGLQFSSSNLSLSGSPSQKISTTTFKVYLENAAGYQIIPLQITVQ